nr:hypothetical protein CFP56_53367 [Quercus suber]
MFPFPGRDGDANLRSALPTTSNVIRRMSRWLPRRIRLWSLDCQGIISTAHVSKVPELDSCRATACASRSHLDRPERTNTTTEGLRTNAHGYQPASVSAGRRQDRQQQSLESLTVRLA